jgi:hypothetical protein
MLQNPTASPTAKAFYDAWLIAISRQEVMDLWPKFRDFTTLIIHRHDGIIVQVATELNLTAWNDNYYHIDSVLYNEKEDKVHGCPEWKTYLHHIRVAFEHENTFNDDLYQEISHLLITSCDLRVLVTYPNTSLLEEKLAVFHEMIHCHPHQKQFSEQENFLIIFGYRDGPRWEGRVYKSDHWIKLP